jgi:REP element-mobilizing transposase RayT
MGNLRENLYPDKYYHIYNHSNGSDNLFRSEENYIYFLKKYAKYFNPVADTYCYCLLPNHFHFLIKIKSELEIVDFFKGKKSKDISDLLSQQFGNFFNSYAKSINNTYGRMGSLFNGSFKRKSVESETYFRNLIHYIHYNPVYHNFVKSIDDWPYSSYTSILSIKDSALKREEVLGYFNGLNTFKSFHKNRIDTKFILELDF